MCKYEIVKLEHVSDKLEGVVLNRKILLYWFILIRVALARKNPN